MNHLRLPFYIKPVVISMVTLKFTVLILPYRLGSNGLHNSPMLGKLVVNIEAEDVESCLLADSGEAVDGLQTNLVSGLESADAIDGGLHGNRNYRKNKH